MINSRRIRKLNDKSIYSGPMLYWMQRDKRADDNWALLFAQELALLKEVPLITVFYPMKNKLYPEHIHYEFLMRGLRDLKIKFREYNIPFLISEKDPSHFMIELIKEYKISSIITDFSPLKPVREQINSLIKDLDIPLFEVDSHNIVPCWTASLKQEYGAYTLRPKIKKILPEFLTEFPKLEKHKYSLNISHDSINLHEVINREEKSINEEAMDCIDNFINTKLPLYLKYNNDPNADSTSDLSSYINYGFISSQRIALSIKKAETVPENKEAFLEQLIIRKELSDNFCFYNQNYDKFSGLPEWAQKTLHEHKNDKRDYIYTREELENAKTHDNLWNASQTDLLYNNRIHGYMRMYWAKKILEWTDSPFEAINTAIYLNDKYQLDGRDPNGYVGCLWAIGGLHDRPWKERDIFGKIRYMNYAGCRRKFDTEKYIRTRIMSID